MDNQTLLDYFVYDKDSGEFFWSDKQKPPFRGRRTGSFDKDGYILLSLQKRKFRAHRVAWLFVHGKWPDGIIDHIDGDPANNRISNLRDVSESVNMQNKIYAGKMTSTGLLGAFKWRNKFSAAIKVNGKRSHLGVFETAELAHAAYMAAKAKIHAGSFEKRLALRAKNTGEQA